MASADPVTQFHLQKLITRVGPVALVTIDNGADWRKPNTFGEAALRSLEEALGRLRTRDWRGLVVTGKPLVFAAGADITQFPGITAERAREGAAAGHELFGRLRELPFPTLAAVNGAALGGGLELALHCDVRTMASNVRHVGFPEVFLGLFPAWGGTQLVPRLVGASAAVKLIVDNPLRQNRLSRAADALELGLVDHVLDPVEFVDESLELLLRRIEAGEGKREPAADLSDVADVVRKARSRVDDAVHGQAPAPYKALELIEGAATWTLEEGYAAEAEALAELLPGPEAQASIYAFDVVERRIKRPAGIPEATPRRIQRVGVVGAGLMATQLATLFLRRLEVPVVLTDVDPERVEGAIESIRGELAGLVAKGRLGEGKARFLGSIVTAGTGLESYAGCDLVLEAVFEELDVKREVFGGLEAVVSPECLLVTNTSALSIAAMADGLEHPERVVGLHFFNPVAVLPLVEVVRTTRNRRRHPRDRMGRDAEARQARGAREGCAGVRREPDAHAAVDRPDAGPRERQHVRGDGRGGAPARSPDAALGAARDGRPPRGEPRPPDAQRRLPEPVPPLPDAAGARGRRAAHDRGDGRPSERRGDPREDPRSAGRRGTSHPRRGCRGDGGRDRCRPDPRCRIPVLPRRDHAPPRRHGCLPTRHWPAARLRLTRRIYPRPLRSGTLQGAATPARNRPCELPSSNG